MTYDKAVLRADLERDEGRRRYLYKDGNGITTVGIGHNIQDKGLSDAAIDFVLGEDIQEAELGLSGLCPGWQEFSDARQRALLNMIFNMGAGTFAQFRKMWAAIAAGDWQTAKAEALDSTWARQVGRRAERVTDLFLKV